MDDAVGVDAAEPSAQCRRQSEAAHFRILTVVSYFKPALTFTRPSLHRSILKKYSRLSSTYSTANGPTPLAMFPQFPLKSSSSPSTGTESAVRTLIAFSPDLAGLAHLGRKDSRHQPQEGWSVTQPPLCWMYSDPLRDRPTGGGTGLASPSLPT
jgi:hypothetical protein